jgi:hypothetical protein
MQRTSVQTSPLVVSRPGAAVVSDVTEAPDVCTEHTLSVPVEQFDAASLYTATPTSPESPRLEAPPPGNEDPSEKSAALAVVDGKGRAKHGERASVRV